MSILHIALGLLTSAGLVILAGVGSGPAGDASCELGEAEAADDGRDEDEPSIDLPGDVAGQSGTGLGCRPEWDFNGVRLTAYSGESVDLAPATLQGFLDEVAAGRATVPVGRVYRLDDIARAHRDMEAGTIGGKGVVLT